jgi:cytochrome c biogenesis protein CcdA
MALYNDLKKPNLTWTNVNELTRNNLKVMKPMLIAIGCSFLNMVIGIMLAVFSETFNLGDYAIYSIYYALCIIPPIIILSIYLKKLLNAEKEFECIGG